MGISNEKTPGGRPRAWWGEGVALVVASYKIPASARSVILQVGQGWV